MTKEHARADLRDVGNLTRGLRVAASRSLPFAARNALNTIAFEGRRVWAGKIERKFVLRNKFTVRSPRVVKAKLQRDIDRMEAELSCAEPPSEHQTTASQHGSIFARIGITITRHPMNVPSHHSARSCHAPLSFSTVSTNAATSRTPQPRSVR